jgi:hypothetical protein
MGVRVVSGDILQWPDQEWKALKTRGPSTALRSGRDDKLVSGICGAARQSWGGYGGYAESLR